MSSPFDVDHAIRSYRHKAAELIITQDVDCVYDMPEPLFINFRFYGPMRPDTECPMLHTETPEAVALALLLLADIIETEAEL